ncbi:hypothetical protein HPP92_015151 [Vanilla planifolia]|uniref:Uncharacterized protein n=1 Tax=Vanilla planifolia TaxID=51239 RepID=A0A835QNY7_VANPL|nr:hypothetical protein HPP92_015151 [Vanilla planifolia]
MSHVKQTWQPRQPSPPQRPPVVGGICLLSGLRVARVPAAGVLPISRSILCQGPLHLIALALCSERLRRITCPSHPSFTDAWARSWRYMVKKLQMK